MPPLQNPRWHSPRRSARWRDFNDGELRSQKSNLAPRPRRTIRSQTYYVAALFIVLLVALALDIMVELIGVDSRPGFSDGRTDVKDRWFVHSRDDY